MRILFMGTPDIAAECLKALYAAGHDICAVYTRRDKPVGRKQVLTAPPVIEVKGKLMLPLFAHSRHIVFPPVLVYGFGAIFGKITVIEPIKISRSISDRVDYPPIRLSCFGIISVSVRQFSPVSFLP